MQEQHDHTWELAVSEVTRPIGSDTPSLVTSQYTCRCGVFKTEEFIPIND